MLRIILYIITILFTLIGLAFAQSVPSKFIVEVEPNPTIVGTANDVTIKVVDENGNIVEDYVWDLIVIVEDENGNEVTDSISTLPGDGVIEFNLEDQWIKKYSKALVFDNPGNYVFKVQDASDDTLEWQTNVEVKDENSTNVKVDIKISSPVDGSIETKLPIQVNAITNMPNTVYKIFVDDKQVSNWLTDSQGQISDYIDNISEWDHKLYISLYDGEGNSLWSSDVVSFTFKSNENKDLFSWIVLIPSNEIFVNDEVVIRVNTKDKVDEVSLSILPENSDTPIVSKMKKIGDNIYEYKTVFTNIWNYKVSVKIINNWNEKEYSDVATIKVKEKPEIYDVKVIKDVKNNKIVLQWNFKWEVSAFKVVYGNEKNNYKFEKIVSIPELEIKNIDFSKVYYFKIYPLNSLNVPVWKASEEVVVDFWQKNAPSCNVQNIKIKNYVNGKKWYITWSKVSNVEKYIIYRAEDIKDKNNIKFVKVWETKDTKWEYPFDITSTKDKYAYFKVEWVCKDWSKVQIWDIKKVKVWPVSTLFIVLISFLFVYSIYFIYSRVK